MKRDALHSLYRKGAMAAAICSAMVSCSDGKDQPVYPDTPMTLSMYSRSSGTIDGEARLFFWDEDKLDKVSTIGTQPYHECVLPGKIDDYKDKIYDTKKYYPQLNTRVYAMGFSPADLQQVVSGNYGTYHLPYSNGEDTTVFASNSIVGSSVYVFREVMEFRPATTQFIFRAIRHQNLYDNLFVRNIKITMPEGSVPNVLRWDNENACYKAAYDKDKEVTDNPINYTGDQLNTTTPTDLGTRYLALQKTNNTNGTTLAGITITAQYSYNQSFSEGNDTWEYTWEDVEIPLKDINGNILTAPVKPGDSYKITITFDKDEFTLYAEKQDWEWGGKIPIPVIIPKEEEENTP